MLDLADEVVGERSGKHILAARARDRAVKLLRAGRILDALEEFHKAKIEWWTGETVRGSLLSMIFIARLYLELRLPQASKSYALAVAYIAALKRDETLADLVPAGLLMAASADFMQVLGVAQRNCMSLDWLRNTSLSRTEVIGKARRGTKRPLAPHIHRRVRQNSQFRLGRSDKRKDNSTVRKTSSRTLSIQ